MVDRVGKKDLKGSLQVDFLINPPLLRVGIQDFVLNLLDCVGFFEDHLISLKTSLSETRNWRLK